MLKKSYNVENWIILKNYKIFYIVKKISRFNKIRIKNCGTDNLKHV